MTAQPAVQEPTPPDLSDPLEAALSSRGAESSPKGFAKSAPKYGTEEYAALHRPKMNVQPPLGMAESTPAPTKE